MGLLQELFLKISLIYAKSRKDLTDMVTLHYNLFIVSI